MPGASPRLPGSTRHHGSLMGFTAPMRRMIAAHAIGFGLAIPAGSPAIQQQSAGAPDDGRWTMPGKDYAGTRYSGLAQLTPGQCRAAQAGVEFLHRGPPRPRRPAAGREQHDVRGDPLPQCPLRVRPDPARLSAQMEIPARGGSQRAGHGLLRRDQPRGLLRRRQDRLQSARRPYRGYRCGDRPGDLERQVADLSDGETTPMAPIVVRDRVIVGRRGANSGSTAGPRALDLATGKLVWTARNAGPDARCWSSPGIFKPFYDKGTGPRAQHLGPGHLEDRRARRSGAGCPTTPSWTWSTTAWESGALQSRAAAGRQQVEQQRAGPAAGRRLRWSGPISSPRTTTGTTTPTPR